MSVCICLQYTVVWNSPSSFLVTSSRSKIRLSFATSRLTRRRYSGCAWILHLFPPGFRCRIPLQIWRHRSADVSLWDLKEFKLPEDNITEVQQKALKEMRNWKDELGHPAGGQGGYHGCDGKGELWQEGQGATRWQLYLLQTNEGSHPLHEAVDLRGTDSLWFLGRS